MRSKKLRSGVLISIASAIQSLNNGSGYVTDQLLDPRAMVRSRTDDDVAMVGRREPLGG